MITMSILGRQVVPSSSKDQRRAYSSITFAEWICWEWISVQQYGDTEAMYLRGLQRPLNEAMTLAGGSIKDLEQYLWAIDADENGEVEKFSKTVRHNTL